MKQSTIIPHSLEAQYDSVFHRVTGVVDAARQSAARSVNALMTGAYWMIGRHIVEFEQSGEERAAYGANLIEKLATGMTQRYGRGFSRQNLWQMRQFSLAYPPERILQTASGESAQPLPRSSNLQTASGDSSATLANVRLEDLSASFPLPWSAYVRLLSVKNPLAREFYEAEALRGGWSVRQLDRQINSQFYERTALSRDKAAMLARGSKAQREDQILPEEAIKDPFVLEFLDLKDEYSESDLEAGLISRLETFLLELGSDFCFMGRQRRLRIGNEWYRVDLLFFHRRLRSLVVIDLKLGKFSHADAGQMHLYLNYAREHWMRDGENPPVGLILCSQKDEAVARYALEGLRNNVMAAEYRTTLPDEQLLASEIEHTREALSERKGSAHSAGEPMSGRVERHDPGPDTENDLEKYCNSSNARWAKLAEDLPRDSPARLPHGFYEAGFSLDNVQPVRSLSEVNDRLREARSIKLTGWSPFLELSTPAWAPYPHENHVEAWVGRPDAEKPKDESAGHSDYWRVSRDGKLYMIRGYQEDDIGQSRAGNGHPEEPEQQGHSTWQSFGRSPPETRRILDPTLPIWRIGEALLFANRFGETFDHVETISVRCRYTGLAGRCLYPMTGSRPFFGKEISNTDGVVLPHRFSPQQIKDNLAEVLHQLLEPLYECFSFFKLPLSMVEEELEKLLR